MGKIILSENSDIVIGEYAFSNCPALQYVTCFAIVPPIISDNTFKSYDSEAFYLFVPEKAVESYRENEVWRYNFPFILSIENPNPQYIEVENAPKEPLSVGDIVQLKAISYPSAEFFDSYFVWTTNNPSVAVVDENGLLKAISPGEALLKVILAGYPENWTLINISVTDQDAGIDGVVEDTYEYRVYNLQGSEILTTDNKNSLKVLNKGLYIINGKKVLVK